MEVPSAPAPSGDTEVRLAHPSSRSRSRGERPRVREQVVADGDGLRRASVRRPGHHGGGVFACARDEGADERARRGRDPARPTRGATGGGRWRRGRSASARRAAGRRGRRAVPSRRARSPNARLRRARRTRTCRRRSRSPTSRGAAVSARRRRHRAARRSVERPHVRDRARTSCGASRDVECERTSQRVRLGRRRLREPPGPRAPPRGARRCCALTSRSAHRARRSSARALRRRPDLQREPVEPQEPLGVGLVERVLAAVGRERQVVEGVRRAPSPPRCTSPARTAAGRRRSRGSASRRRTRRSPGGAG